MMDRILEILQEFGCNPDEFDVFKVANEIREIVMEELKLTKSDQSWQDPLVKRFFATAEDMENYWLDKA